ncbi:unnamed protein product [Strongylus vulgaris]|uniref:Uncharacterized protein n=1 Tax=Strongylus vulgaris TaxID=40348 RepID=A0A3P7KC62_STRVU|nr:unnamed protein product [Strongylus vulgaris]
MKAVIFFLTLTRRMVFHDKAFHTGRALALDMGVAQRKLERRSVTVQEEGEDRVQRSQVEEPPEYTVTGPSCSPPNIRLCSASQRSKSP